MATIRSTKRSPFDLPELRYKISRLVNVNDALACALVCKAWTADFVSAIWWSINLDEHPDFGYLSRETISKYGRYIRIVKSEFPNAEVSSLDDETVNKLEKLIVYLTTSVVTNSHIYEIIRRNVRELCLLDIDFSFGRDRSNTFLGGPIFADPLSIGELQSTTTVLTRLNFGNLYIRYDEFVATLRACPMLQTLTMYRIEFEKGIVAPSFKHMGLDCLYGSVECIFPQDDLSLLSCFPNMTYLDLWSDLPENPLPIARIKAAIAQYCPNLDGYGLEDGEEVVTQFCTHIFSTLDLLRINCENISAETMDAILLHRNTSRNFMHFTERDFSWSKTDEVAQISDKYQPPGSLILQIPRTCSRLEHWSFHLYEMEIDDIEGGEWVCRDLKKLRFRVKGLDTKEKITRTIELWRGGSRERWRRQAKRKERIEKNEKEELQEERNIDMSIEGRVARHLLKLEKLEKVWLGYQSWDLV